MGAADVHAAFEITIFAVYPTHCGRGAAGCAVALAAIGWSVTAFSTVAAAAGDGNDQSLPPNTCIGFTDLPSGQGLLDAQGSASLLKRGLKVREVEPGISEASRCG